MSGRELFVGDWPVDVTVAAASVEFVVHSGRPRSFLTISVRAEGVTVRGELPAMNTVAWQDLRDLMSRAGEALFVLRAEQGRAVR